MCCLTPLLRSQSVVKLANSSGEWTERRLWRLARRVVLAICAAAYATAFLAAVITFFSTCTNMSMTLADKLALAYFSFPMILFTGFLAGLIPDNSFRDY